MQALINIDVPALDAAIAFYEAALPLRLARRLFGGTVAELLGASSVIYLLENPDGSLATTDADARRDYRPHWTPVHLDFVVDDAIAARDKAVAAGARVETSVQEFPWGWLTTLRDPFGNGFCLVQFRGGIYQGAD